VSEVDARAERVKFVQGAGPCPLRARSDGDQWRVAGTHGHSTGICPGRRFPCSEAMISKESQADSAGSIPVTHSTRKAQVRAGMAKALTYLAVDQRAYLRRLSTFGRRA
jgi:hypothetical protein